LDLTILEAKLKVLGGSWRIHKTVNLRDTEKAKKWLLHKLIETSQFDGCIDSLWRTALLQSECKAEKNFLLDIDTKELVKLDIIREILSKSKCTILEMRESPNGYHFITTPFDTRNVCKLPYVTLIRDGYIFVKKIENK
jgi:hypothetical protein